MLLWTGVVVWIPSDVFRLPSLFSQTTAQWKRMAASSCDENEIHTHATQRSKDILCVFACSYKTLYLSIQAITPLWVVKSCNSIKSLKAIQIHTQLLIKLKKVQTRMRWWIFCLYFSLNFCSTSALKARRSHCGSTYHDCTTTFPCLYWFSLSKCLRIPIVCRIWKLYPRYSVLMQTVRLLVSHNDPHTLPWCSIYPPT